MNQAFDTDLFFAVLLHEMGISGAPQAFMPEWEFDALAFAQANGIEQFHATPEYHCAEVIGQFMHAFNIHI